MEYDHKITNPITNKVAISKTKPAIAPRTWPLVTPPIFINFSKIALFFSVYGGNRQLIGYKLSAFVSQIDFGLLNARKPDLP